MRVLWVFNHPAPYKVAFHEALARKGVELDVVYERSSERDRNKNWYLGGREKAQVSFNWLDFRCLPLGTGNDLSFLLPKIYERGKYDLVVVNGYSTLSEMHFLSFLKKNGIPYVFAINGGIVPKKECPLKAAVKRHFIEGADLYLSPDGNSSRYLLHYGAENERIRLYPYSTIHEKDVLARPLSKREKRAAWALDPYANHRFDGLERVFVAVGSFTARKNILRLLELWKISETEAGLVLIGEGQQRDKYRSYIEEHNLKNVLVYPFLPHEEILKRLAYADMSIFMTKEDIYGHVVNESLSQGTPVLASIHANSSLKLIEDGVNGYLFDPELDTEKFIGIVTGDIDPAMGENAIKTAAGNTIETMAEAHLSIFNEYLAHKK